MTKSKLKSEFTDSMYFAMRDGVCVACGWQQTGARGISLTAKMVAEWIRKGLSVELHHKDAPRFKELFDQIYARAKEAADAARKAKEEEAR